jgi:hypothetical protein
LSCKQFSLHEHWYHEPKPPHSEGEKEETSDAVVTQDDVF